ncbi:MAG TPA: archease [Vicinamibacterales bacterium]|jgi:SHS2 domain-containing protein|nr:archease [Vicinamibacterales bacterium]
MHEFFDHTGDIGVRIRAADPPALFEAAAVAMTDAMTSATVEPRQTDQIALEATDLDLLLVDWLSELLYRFETRAFLVARAHVDLALADGSHQLRARIEGEPFDARRHPLKVLLKAVTYHALDIRQHAEGWTATVIFDI